MIFLKIRVGLFGAENIRKTNVILNWVFADFVAT